MSKQANTTLIGGFVVGAVVLVIAGVLLFSSGKILTKQIGYVLFFNESINGLNIGAPVDFKGVKVGSVIDIKIMLNPKDLSLLIPVYIEIEPKKVTLANPGMDSRGVLPEQGSGVIVRQLIQDGLKAQLEMQSLVTGQLGVHLDFFPDQPVRLVGADPSVPEIPTKESSLSQLSKTFERLPIDQIANKLLLTIDGLEKLVNSTDLKETVANLNQTLKDAQRLLHNFDGRVSTLATSADRVLGDADRLIQNVDTNVKPLASSVTQAANEAGALMHGLNASVPHLVSRMDDTLKATTATVQQANKAVDAVAGQNSAVRVELVRALTELADAARSVRVVADYLQRHPESLIRGKGK